MVSITDTSRCRGVYVWRGQVGVGWGVCQGSKYVNMIETRRCRIKMMDAS